MTTTTTAIEILESKIVPGEGYASLSGVYRSLVEFLEDPTDWAAVVLDGEYVCASCFESGIETGAAEHLININTFVASDEDIDYDVAEGVLEPDADGSVPCAVCDEAVAQFETRWHRVGRD